MTTTSRTQRVLVCGDRNWTNAGVIRARLQRLPSPVVIVHGAARGADSMAGEIAQQLGFGVEDHPAKWKLYGRGAGPLRNQAMLDSGVDLVLAFHNDLSRSKGTADMVRRARAAGVKVEVIDEGRT
jgi:hypothetical protein